MIADNYFTTQNGVILVKESVSDLDSKVFNNCYCFDTDLEFYLFGQGISGDYLGKTYNVIWKYYKENNLNKRIIIFLEY
jgi:hypothetical protein